MTRDWSSLRDERLPLLDDETRAMFEARQNMPSLRGIGLEALRQIQVPEAGGVAAGVRMHNVEVPGPAGPIPTRIYTPEGEGPFGVYIHYHGGGFIFLGGLETLDVPNSEIAANVGCVVVAPDFRMAPEDPFPASVDDCWAVAQWVGANATEQGWDPDRIAVGGGCTGGSFATVVALMARDAGAPRIAFQNLQVPILDLRCDTQSHFEFAEGYMLLREDNLYVIELYLAESEDRWDWRASPILADSMRGVAPAYIVTGEYDILRDEGHQYANRLRDAGVDVTYRCIPGQSHVFSRSTSEALKGDTHALLRRYIGQPATRSAASVS